MSYGFIIWFVCITVVQCLYEEILNREIIWPKPKSSRYGTDDVTVTKGHLKINLDGVEDCPRLIEAKKNYENDWFFPKELADSSSPGQLTELKLIKSDDFQCPQGYSYPKITKDESYQLTVNGTNAILSSGSVWGFLRGVESFSQLITYKRPRSLTEPVIFTIRSTAIEDEPAYPVRGLMLDTGRHFLPVDVILRQIDVMSQSKFNLFHWHIADSESFPYQSLQYPNLPLYGAYGPKAIYTKQDMKRIITYANIRGIRVVPEFDTPGHMGSWRGQPGLLAVCSVKSNILDPSKEENYRFLKGFFKEVIQLFPDEYLHLGGDEVSSYAQCWEKNVNIQKWAKDNNLLTTKDIERYYLQRLLGIINDISTELNIKRTVLVWEEAVFMFKTKLPNVIAVPWYHYASMKTTTQLGYQSINAACYYINYVTRPGADWRQTGKGPEYGNFYNCHPADYVFPGTEALNLGGIAAMWGEYEDKNNLESDLWPRAATVAEKLWSPYNKTLDATKAIPRLHRFRCRLNWRGYRASPTDGPDYCSF
ncbi:unnamed protein product [Bursaphelenchus okinawaensis]|uniref:Beta-hexosaminidase n=1 Tax=Bursaphelenchus okinawaensis TaxID=465554 RepID=A0A811LH77_9BILA|nr:unnamed protein product [Bursaphelenchus okinawaensis]CAG9123757.1 unnamed protein product [Bursaphelenchus okinawaensis]